MCAYIWNKTHACAHMHTYTQPEHHFICMAQVSYIFFSIFLSGENSQTKIKQASIIKCFKLSCCKPRGLRQKTEGTSLTPVTADRRDTSDTENWVEPDSGHRWSLPCSHFSRSLIIYWILSHKFYICRPIYFSKLPYSVTTPIISTL